MNREELLNHLEQESHVLEVPAIKRAFSDIDRADFITEEYQSEAYEDYAVPIGHDQTISKPTIVAFMLELLDAQAGDEVLDIGSGSGWTTALLAHIVGDEGRVIGIEIIPELAERSRENLQKYDFAYAEVVEGVEAEIGLPAEGQFDRILVSAAAEVIPEELIAQLKPGGIMVIPVAESIVRVRKPDRQGNKDENNEDVDNEDDDNGSEGGDDNEDESWGGGETEAEDGSNPDIEISEYPGFPFAPLVY